MYNPKETAEKILVLLRNKKLREKMGLAGRKRVKEYFTQEKMIKEYEKLYLKMIKEKN